jgi:hypothetical protein
LIGETTSFFAAEPSVTARRARAERDRISTELGARRFWPRCC